MNTKAAPPPLLPQRLSLVAQTVQSLREAIRAGHWRTHLPGERELCAHLQVSRPTLRAALEDLQRHGWLDVSHRQRRRIRARPAASRRAPKKEIAMLSACPLLEMPPPMMFVVDVLRDKLAEAGYATKFHVNRACFSAQPVHALDKLARQNPSAVWLVFGSKEPMQRWFIRQQLPCVVAGSCAPTVALPSVDVDFRATCRHAGGVLLRKGHRRLALVLPQDAYGGDVVSEEGLREALASMQGDAQLRVLRHDGTAPHLCSLLDEALRLPNPPTAFLVARAPHVLAAMMHLMRRGKRIPQDAAVISRDNDPFLESTSPVVARYAINQAQFARRLSMAARQLAETGTLPAHAIRLMPRFLPGETV
ncbi:MAG: substrate-binding domain-containing protein [Verrucomicrobia bacterium]|nr:substrate-binding domain-containing protein [Verrucomicrobiota bacterium]